MSAHPGLTLGDIVIDNARRFASLPAYICDARQVSHAQLFNRARRLGSALHGLGVRHQDRVAVLAMNTIEFGEILAASQLSGIIVATVNYRLAAPEVLWILKDAAPRVVIFEAQYLEMVNQLRPQLSEVKAYICIGGRADWAQDYEELLSSGSEAGAPFHSSPEDIACLIYTSGTTGRPKGCILGQREMRTLAHTMNNEMRSGCNDRVMLVMPLFHIGAMAIGLGAQYRGGCIVLRRQFEAGDALRTISDRQISILHVAPTLLLMLLDHPQASTGDFSSVRTVLYSAAPMPVPLLRRAISAMPDADFLNLYGQTEVITSGLPREMHKPQGDEREQRWLLSIGHPFPNTLVRIVADDGSDCAVGETGEIAVRTAAMFRGYWNNHAATLETLRDGWCRTGDMGRFDDDGLLYLVDRKKDMIISGGENIYSREVEEAVSSHPAVAECAVIGLPDPKWGESVCAVVVLKAGQRALESEIIEYTRTQIASYKKPRTIILTEQLPKLPTGKINKVALRDLYAR